VSFELTMPNRLGRESRIEKDRKGTQMTGSDGDGDRNTEYRQMPTRE
jgi:hypothetical protein